MDKPFSTTKPEFRERLAKLNQITLALARCNSLDELAREAIVLGMHALNFERLGIWLLSDTPGVLRGTFGTDEQGQVRDEHEYHLAITAIDDLTHYVNQQDQRSACQISAHIYDTSYTAIGEGWLAVVGLWDGEKLAGYLFADNLLQHLPYTEEEQTLLTLYASTLSHLYTHLHFAETLHQRREAANTFLNKMASLSRVAAHLTRCSSLDELCRNAIILGRQELGFDRLGLWFSGAEDDIIIGMYGTDEHGALRDERGLVKRVDDFDFALSQALRNKERYAFQTGIIIHSLQGQPLHYGWAATAALWDGEKVIGYLFTDNFLQQLPYSEDEGELLALYALLLGHLCTRQRIEETLRKREANYRALIEAIPDYLFVATHAGFVLDYHPAQSARFPTQPTALIGKTAHDILPTALADQYTQAIEEVLQTGKAVTLEHTLYGGESLRHLEARISAAGHEQVLVLVRDVTQRKQLEEQLYAAQKMESLGRMAGGIAHDFNNLLTVIQSFAEVAERQAPTNLPKLQKALTQIRTASAQGARLTTQLLLFARKQAVEPQILDVNQLLLNLKTILHPLLGEGITLQLALTPALGLVQIDPGQFEQVIINLAVNAHDAMADGGCFTIRTRDVVFHAEDVQGRLNLAAGDYILIEVSDTGVGIDQALQKQIFDPFFTTKDEGKGTGLGLAICHSIIQQNNGQLLVQSAPNQGATFQIFLPRTTKPASIAAQPSALPIAQGIETILLVEDDEPVREVAVEVLSSYGYTVLACAAGADAVQKAQEYPKPINLLMTDILMPQMNGKEVAEQFMRLRPNVPVLLISGYVDELPEPLMSKPNVTFLPKPYTLLSLVTTVRAVLDQAHTLAAHASPASHFSKATV